MSKEFVEPEEKELNDTISEAQVVMDDFNPLDEAISEKEYTKPNVRFDAKDLANDIPEPSFMPPPMGGMALNEDKKDKKPEEPFNPQMSNLPKKDKHDAADKVAKMIMTGYSWINDVADKSLLFNEKKVLKMQQEGLLDLSIEVPVTPTTSISAGEFIQEYNEQSRGTISVSKQFEEEVTPVLTRVLEKRGVGMSDEQYLIYLFGKDIAVKGFMITQSLSVKKDMLNMLKESTDAIKASNVSRSTPPPPPPPPQQSYQEQVYQEPIVEQYNQVQSVNDEVNEMVGAIPKKEKVQMTIITDTSSSAKGKRGRPSKKK